jgi:hypothetical protein
MNIAKASVLACVATAAIGCAAPAGSGSDLEQRQTEVARAGSTVMRFDLERTTHVFEKRDDGGLQTVLADSDDPEQVALIRAHLRDEAERFARGDFHDPSMIHGDDMPGLHTLVMGRDRLRIAYRDVERGGAIEYRALDAELVDAIHVWFDAQLSDHGDHAQPHP